MAGRINYEALDSIIPAHSINTFYDLTFAQEILNDSGNFVKTVNVSLNGSEEVMFTRTNELWNIKASYLTSALVLEWKEFFYSTKLGESFTYYPDTGDLSTNYTCIMVTKKYAPTRVGTTDNDFSFTFIIKKEV